MRAMTRILATVLAGLSLALLPACGDDEGSDDAAPAITVTESTTTDETESTTTGDTTSTTTGETTTGETTTQESGGAEDVSGNCDEAEHADDPECQ